MAEFTYKVNIDWVKAQTSLKDLTASLDRLSKKLDEFSVKTNQTFKKSTSNAKTYKKTLGELEVELKQLQAAYQKVYNQDPFTRGRQKKLSEYRKEMTRVKTQMDRVAASQQKINNQVSIGRQLMLRLKSVMLTVFGAYAIINGIRNTVNIVKEFELGMARLQAITGKTREEIDELANSARILSTTGIFSAKEIAELQVKLAKLGFTIQEIADSTEGIVDLATATGEDLASSAELVASVIRGLGLDASETSRVVDVLGKSFTSSALDMNKFRESAKFIVPLAREMGWEIEELAAVTGKLADNIISGSLAGTGLRTLFIELSDPTSKLSQIMGEGVNTFDEFIDAMIRMQEEGVSTAEILEAVPKRAVTLFVSLMNMGESVRTFAEDLRDANGAINEMAEVQMETLAYQSERVANAWAGWILSLQDNGGWLKSLFESIADTLEGMARYVDPMAFALGDAAITAKSFLDAIGGRNAQGKLKAIEERIEDLNDGIAEEVELYNKLKKAQAEGLITTPGLDKLAELEVLFKGVNEQIRILNAEAHNIEVGEIVDRNLLIVDKRIKELRAGGIEEGEAIVQAYREIFEKLEEAQLDLIRSGGDISALGALLDAEKEIQEDFNRFWEQFTEDEKRRLAKLLKDREEWIKNTRKLYALEKQLYLERNENIVQSELDRELEVLAINREYTKKNLELDLASGKLTEKQTEVVKQLLLELEETYQRERFELIRDYNEKYRGEFQRQFDEELKLMKTRNDIELQEMKNAGATKEEIWRREMEQLIHMQELRIQMAALFGQDTRQLTEDLKLLKAELAGGFDSSKIESDTKKIGNAYKKLATEVIDSLQTIVDAQVENTERLVDDLNTRIAETQRQLEIETELYAAGYANNVTLRQNELDELNEIRDQAIKDREAAIRKQQALEAVAQAIDLAGAVANTINIYSEIPFVGLALAGVAVAGFLALFAASQKQAKSLTQYGDGGEINGNPHSMGGVPIEAEGGEFVVKKTAYYKHRDLVNAINNDDLPRLDHAAIYNIGDNHGGDVVVDNKVWHEIKDLLGQNLNKKTTEVYGNKKVITSGIRKRNIRLN